MRFLTIIVSFLVPISLFAQQPVQGQKFVEGNISFSVQKRENAGVTTSFTFSPSLGFMVTDRMAVGGSLGYSAIASDDSFASINPITGEITFINRDSKTTSLAVSSFVGWFLPITEQVGLNIETELGLLYSKNNGLASISTTELYTFTFQFTPSLYYFVTDKIALNASLGGLLFKQGLNKEIDNTTSFRLSLRSNAFFGLQYFWGRE